MKKLISLFIVFAIFLGAAFGKTVYVNANHPANGDGTSWSSPYTNLQTAVDAAAAGDLVLVTNGVYSPISTGNKAITIQSVEGSSVTSIDGGGTTRCATLGTGVVLKGFTLFNGYTTSSGGGAYGGTLTDCVISGNTANNHGGGSYDSTLTDCVISGNTANQYGGGIYGASIVSNCVVAGNIARSGANGIVGGGIHGNGVTVVMDSLISGNIATNTYAQAGGVGYATVYRCRIENNMARNGGGTYRCNVYDNSTIVSNIATYAGGGVGTHATYDIKIHDSTIEYNRAIGAYGGGTLHMLGSNCVIRGNTANTHGGGSYGGTLTGCTISGNTAATYGGGSYVGTLTGCTISGNTSTSGGGTCYSVVYNSAIYNNTATVSWGALSRGLYYNCTIYSNTAPDYAVGSADGQASEPSIYNCVIYGNVNTGPNARQLQVPTGGIFYCSSIDSVDKFDLGANTPTVFPIYGDPQFTDPANDDFTLLPTSPCINKGANQYVTTTTDLQGSPRIKDWRVDMGAYESQSTRFVTTPNALFPMGTKDIK